MPLNEFNKSRSILIRNLFMKRKRINKCRERRKGLKEKEEINTQNKENTILKIILYYIEKNIKLNNIIFNLVRYSE
jgi:hypothetical protein